MGRRDDSLHETAGEDEWHAALRAYLDRENKGARVKSIAEMTEYE